MPLTTIQVRTAVRYNVRRSFEVALIERIQRTVGSTADGLFGPRTVQAVADFQASHGLEVDGMVGEQTLSALQALWAQDPGAPGLSPSELQRALRYNRGQSHGVERIRSLQRTVGVPETGEYDEPTVQAVARFQTQHDLVSDGMVGPHTLRVIEALERPQPATHTVYRIHPGIGVARLGDSPVEYFVGPEAPGLAVPTPPSGHRDASGLIKRQAARFRVYAYDLDGAGEVQAVREVLPEQAQIHWRVRLVNRKAAAPNFPPGSGGRRNAGVDEASLVIDSGAQEVTGADAHVPLQGVFMGSPVRLGDLRTDSRGRLLVLGGHGLSRSRTGTSIASYANNDGWHDDVGDGPVEAELSLVTGETVRAEPAWVVVAAPAYAPETDHVTTWWDHALHLATLREPTRVVERVSFTRHIYPILARVARLAWVSGAVRAGHGPDASWNFLADAMLRRLSGREDAALRRKVFESLRQPDGGGRNMPMMNTGIDPQEPREQRAPTLTPTQLRWLEQWAVGDFEADWAGEPAPARFDDIAVREQPEALDRAALEACIGGPFYPGIEASYRMALPETYGSVFRVAEGTVPGMLTADLAVPWQADFYACGERWWPAQRPVSVYREGQATPSRFDEGVSGMAGMVTAWADLGFVRRRGDRYEEILRIEPVPNS